MPVEICFLRTKTLDDVRTSKGTINKHFDKKSVFQYTIFYEMRCMRKCLIRMIKSSASTSTENKKAYHMSIEEDFASDWIRENIGNYDKPSTLDLSGSYFKLFGNEQNYRRYYFIQKKMSQIIPREYKRPIIEFHFEGSEWKAGDPTCCIVGGMGPVSDSQLLDKVLQKTSTVHAMKTSKKFHIKLLSIPPPRAAIELLCGGFSYFCRLWAFLRIPCDRVYLASNTAHIYLSMFRTLSAAPVIDMTQQVTNYLASPLVSSDEKVGSPNHQPSPRVLILGTLAGHKNQLYESKLRDRNIQFVTLSFEDKVFVQEVIDSTKENRLLTKQISNLMKIIQKSFENDRFDILLLACTELPIALQEIVSNQSLTIGNDVVTVVDSELIFAEIVWKHFQG